MSTRREITRAATVAEIKATAMRLMREQASSDVRFADIAREMSMTGPALYRYFANRDELVTALLEDAYGSLAERLEKALSDSGFDDAAAAFLGVCRAYREWAIEDQTRYTLVFGVPIPGYEAPEEEGPHSASGQRAFECLTAPALIALRSGRDVTPLGPDVTGPLLAAFEQKAGPVPPQVMQVLLHAWAAIHGFISLETFGHFHWCAGEASDDLFEGLVRGLAGYIGLTAAPAAPAAPTAPTEV